MAFYRKNMGSVQQLARVGVGIGIAALAVLHLSGPVAWMAGIVGIGFALSGLVGYCPMCAVAGMRIRG